MYAIAQHIDSQCSCLFVFVSPVIGFVVIYCLKGDNVRHSCCDDSALQQHQLQCYLCRLQLHYVTCSVYTCAYASRTAGAGKHQSQRVALMHD